MIVTVTTGEGSAAAFVESAADLFTEAFGFRPFHGTLNLDAGDDEPDLAERLPWDANEHCDGVDYEQCYVSGVRAALIRPDVPNYPPDKVELLAPVQLRDFFGIEDDDRLSVGGDPWAPDGLRTRLENLDAFDAVVFDFDGTLADLAVDWGAVQADIAELLDDHLDRSLTEYDRPEIFRIARDAGVYDDVESLLTTAENNAVPDSVLRPEGQAITSLECPVGICTANGSEPVRAILERHGLDETVETTVARDTLPESKPDPKPLLRCIEDLSVAPGNTLFVGDKRTDAIAAHEAGASFLHPKQIRTGDE